MSSMLSVGVLFDFDGTLGDTEAPAMDVAFWELAPFMPSLERLATDPAGLDAARDAFVVENAGKAFEFMLEKVDAERAASGGLLPIEQAWARDLAACALTASPLAAAVDTQRAKLGLKTLADIFSASVAEPTLLAQQKADTNARLAIAATPTPNTPAALEALVKATCAVPPVAGPHRELLSREASGLGLAAGQRALCDRHHLRQAARANLRRRVRLPGALSVRRRKHPLGRVGLRPAALQAGAGRVPASRLVRRRRRGFASGPVRGRRSASASGVGRSRPGAVQDACTEPPCRCVAVEDSASGVGSAANAKIGLIVGYVGASHITDKDGHARMLMRGERSEDGRGADVVLADMADLPAVVAAFGAGGGAAVRGASWVRLPSCSS